MARATKRNFCLGILLVFLISINSNALAASSPEGFVGVPWGASRSQVKQLMNERGWERCTDSPQTEEVFKGSFNGLSGDLHFVIVGNALVEGAADPLARYPLRNSTATQREYERTIKSLTEKYGPPQKTEVNGMSYSGNNVVAWGPTAVWEFGDGVTTDKYEISVTFNSEGTNFFGMAGKQTYFVVVYKAISLRERLKNKEL